jgi:hypothetical protein
MRHRESVTMLHHTELATPKAAGDWHRFVEDLWKHPAELACLAYLVPPVFNNLRDFNERRDFDSVPGHHVICPVINI